MFSKKTSHEHCWHPENRMEKTLETISFTYKDKQSTSLDGLSGNFVARRCYRIWDMLWYCNDLILTFNQKHQKKWEVPAKPTPFKRVGSPQWPCCLVQDFQCWVQVCRDDCEARTQARKPLWEAESCWMPTQRSCVLRASQHPKVYYDYEPFPWNCLWKPSPLSTGWRGNKGGKYHFNPFLDTSSTWLDYLFRSLGYLHISIHSWHCSQVASTLMGGWLAGEEFWGRHGCLR